MFGLLLIADGREYPIERSVDTRVTAARSRLGGSRRLEGDAPLVPAIEARHLDVELVGLVGPRATGMPGEPCTRGTTERKFHAVHAEILSTRSADKESS